MRDRRMSSNPWSTINRVAADPNPRLNELGLRSEIRKFAELSPDVSRTT
jgi:hypothetical protein